MKKTTIFTMLAAFGLLLVTGQAFGAGTLADTTISNIATVEYTVLGVVQTPVTSGHDTDGDGDIDAVGATTFKVDRKVDLTVAFIGDITVAPGQTNAVMRYSVTNNSNETLDFGLSSVRFAGDFTSSLVGVYVDAGTLGTYDGPDTATYIDELAPDATAFVWVVADIDASALNTETETWTLRATAKAGGTASTEGATLATAGANSMTTAETVLADGTGANDDGVADGVNGDDYDGIHSANSDFVVSTATLTVAKSVAVYDTGSGLPTDSFAIPGAIVTYSITITNSGAASATGIALIDEIPSNTCFYVTSGPTGGTTYDYANESPFDSATSAWDENPEASAVDPIGCDTDVTAIRINAANIAGSGGTSTATFKVKIQ